MYESTAPVEPVASLFILAGRLKSGGVVSTTVRLNPPLSVLPDPSVAVQLATVVLNANVEPEAGVHVQQLNHQRGL